MSNFHDDELDKELLDFVCHQEAEPRPHKLRDVIKRIAVEALINNEADITGYCKNDALGTAYIELTWRYNDD